ncbi:MAG: CoA transferase [Chloroflexi bacterium]|nr:CoA transferase [Chloroflexota bacterium]
MLALEGIRVIDWTIYQAGPVAGEMLGDFGAEVIKVEQRGVGDPGRSFITAGGLRTRLGGDRNWYFETNNRNKKSITLDLTKPQAKEVMRRLVEKSDVFVQNFRQGVAEKYQLDYDSLRSINPRIIYGCVSGLGEKGLESQRPTMDPVGVFRSGFAFLAPMPNQEPCYPPGGIGDQTNAWSMAYGIVMALLARERHGVGQKVTSSFLSSLMWVQGLSLGAYLYAGTAQAARSRQQPMNPLANYYRCADGKWLVIHLHRARYWLNFCEATGLVHLVDDPRFKDLEARLENRVALLGIVEEVFASKTQAEWMDIFGKYPDLIYERAQLLPDLVGDPQVIANDYMVDFDHPTMGKMKAVAPPAQLSETPWGIQLPPPEFGQHTEEVLTEVCGYTWEELETLREAEVI